MVLSMRKQDILNDKCPSPGDIDVEYSMRNKSDLDLNPITFYLRKYSRCYSLQKI